MRNDNSIFTVVASLSAALCTCPAAHAANYIWDDSTGDHLWSTTNNWKNDSGLPGSSDIVAFDNTQIGVSTVNQSFVLGFLYFTNRITSPPLTNDIAITPGATLQLRRIMAGHVNTALASSTTDVHVVMSGGTLQLGNTVGACDLFIGYRPSGAQAPTTSEIVMSNMVVHLSNTVSVCWIGYTVNEQAACTGIWNIANATVVSGAYRTNVFQFNGELGVGQQYAQGELYLPPSVTNITVTNLMLGSVVQLAPRDGIIDLGVNPQLQTLLCYRDMNVQKGYFRYVSGATTNYDLPPNLSLYVGTPASPANFRLAFSGGSSTTNRWKNLGRFENYLTSLIIARSSTSVGNTVGELDLSNPATVLVGSVSSNAITVPTLEVGSEDGGNPQGILWLPPTMQSITCSNFDFGASANFAVIPHSRINLGTNSQFRTLVVSNEFKIGRASFIHWDGSGTMYSNSLPSGTAMRVGTGTGPSQRGSIYMGNAIFQATRLDFGAGISDFVAYLRRFDMCNPFSDGHFTYTYFDLRNATNVVINVMSNMNIGVLNGANSTFYLPAGARVTTSNLVIGTDDYQFGDWENVLWLSNAVVVVSNAVTVDEEGTISNYIDGISSGIDLATTNLNLLDGQPPPTFPDYGFMRLEFRANPLHPNQDYWGLRVKGNAVAMLQGYTNTSPQRLQWSTNGLSGEYLQKFGIRYNAENDTTIVGILGVPFGTQVWLR